MKALCYYGTRDIRYESVPDPELKDDRDVIVKVIKCGICGSDLHIYHGQVPLIPCGSSVGHEAVGEVVEVGKSVRRLKPGTVVMMIPGVACGECEACLRGNTNRCELGTLRGYGYGYDLDGCQAEALRVPVGDLNAIAVPEGISLDQAIMLTDNLATAFAACKRADIRMGGSAAVVGLGCVGLNAVECAFVLGASRVFAIDPIAERREFARRLGAIPLDPSVAEDEIREATRGDLADSVIEAVGSKATIAMALRLVGKLRTVSIAGAELAVASRGGAPIDVEIPIKTFLHGITVRAMASTEVALTWNELVPLLREGRLHSERFISSEQPLSCGVSAYQALDSRANGMLKAVLVP